MTKVKQVNTEYLTRRCACFLLVRLISLTLNQIMCRYLVVSTCGHCSTKVTHAVVSLQNSGVNLSRLTDLKEAEIMLLLFLLCYIYYIEPPTL